MASEKTGDSGDENPLSQAGLLSIPGIGQI